MKKKTDQKIRVAALALLHDLNFLFRVVCKIREMGVLGEEKNALTLFLATLTKDLNKSVSVLVKGPSSSGKNNVVRSIVNLVPPESVISRTSLTAKSQNYGEESLSGKVFYISEYRGGKDAEYLTRQLQSEGALEHEHTVMSGNNRTTRVARRAGNPVFVTTTTDLRVYEDDETRFLSLRADESPELTRAVLEAQFRNPVVTNGQPGLDVWQEVHRVLTHEPPEFIRPEWLGFVARQIPAKHTRARRDGGRLLALLEAVALCHSFSDEKRKGNNKAELSLADYAVAHAILNEAFGFTYDGAHPNALKVAEAVRELFGEGPAPVKVEDVAQCLSWKKALVYKWLDAAVEKKLVVREVGTNEKNLKRLFPCFSADAKFLPDPLLVLREGQSIVKEVSYVDPLSGETKKLVRDRKK